MKKVTRPIRSLIQQICSATPQVSRRSILHRPFTQYLLVAWLFVCVIAAVALVPGTAFAHTNQRLSQKQTIVQGGSFSIWNRCVIDTLSPQAPVESLTLSSLYNSLQKMQDFNDNISLDRQNNDQGQLQQDLFAAGQAILFSLPTGVSLNYDIFRTIAAGIRCYYSTSSTSSSLSSGCDASNPLCDPNNQPVISPDDLAQLLYDNASNQASLPSDFSTDCQGDEVDCLSLYGYGIDG